MFWIIIGLIFLGIILMVTYTMIMGLMNVSVS